MSTDKTIVGDSVAEITEKRSRFIAHLHHVESEGEAREFLGAIRTEHSQARHNVYAYILKDGPIRFSDDGEPAQTAGLPVLEALGNAGLSDVVCVVTRYFGGTLLGTGGLVRAYSQATQEAIDGANIAVVERCSDMIFAVPYSLYDQIRSLADGTHAKIIDSDFQENVRIAMRVKADKVQEMRRKLTELSHGQLSLDESEPYDAIF